MTAMAVMGREMATGSEVPRVPGVRRVEAKLAVAEAMPVRAMKEARMMAPSTAEAMRRSSTGATWVRGSATGMGA